jgi:chromosome partitioning protein
MDVTRLSVRELRATIAATLEQVMQGERIVVERHGSPVAALVPIGDYHQLTLKEPRMTHRVAFNNVSGGEGKTFLTFHLAFALADLGYRVAALDTDPQASLTKRFGLHDEPGPAHQPDHTVLPVFQTESDEPRLPPPLRVHNLDVWPANRHLLLADGLINTDISKLGNLHAAVTALEAEYDFILLDTRPAVSPLLSAVIAAAQHLIVPISADKGMENLDELARLTRIARKYDRQAGVRLFVPNKVTSTRLGKDVLRRISAYTVVAPMSPPVRNATIGGESEQARLGITRFAPRSPLAADIRVLAEALVQALTPQVVT